MPTKIKPCGYPVKSGWKAGWLFDRLNDLCAFLVIVLLLYLMVSISLDALMRYFLNRPQIWVPEIAEFCLPVITFLGAAWLLKKEGHVKMDLVFVWLNPRQTAFLNLITSIVGSIVALFLVWYGARVAWNNLQIGYFTPVLRIPTAPILACVPFGSFLLFVQFLRRAIESLDHWRASSGDELKR